MKRGLTIAAALVLATAGVGAGFAAGGGPGNVACATTPAHTVAVDGSPVDTTPGDVECATAATVTVTVGGSTTTPPTTTTPTTTTNPPPSYLFDDEFNGAAGSKPSSTLWGVKTGSSNGSAHWNGWNQISEDGQGDLVITAQKISGTWQSGFLSGKIGYSGPRRIEVRAKLACGAGVWNAPVWEWGYPYGGSPSIENDVNEALTGKDPVGEYHATLHNWNGGSSPQAGKVISTGQNLCGAFHTYAADVYPDHVDFYFDGTLEASIAAASVGLTSLTSWEEVANIDLNMGGWAGTIGSETSVSMFVDYIRVSAL